MGISRIRGIKGISHPDCQVCRKRLAYQRQLRRQWRTVKACSVCGEPSGLFLKCLKHRVQDAACQRARRKQAAAKDSAAQSVNEGS